MKKLLYSGLTALTMLFVMVGLVNAQNTHTVTFDPVQGSIVKTGTAISVTVSPTATEVLFKVFATREAAQAEAPSVVWDPIDGTADGTPKVTVENPVLAVAVKAEGNAYEVFYAEYTVKEEENLPKLTFPELKRNKDGQYLYGRYSPFKVELMYDGQKQTAFELYYCLEGNSAPTKERYNPDNDPGTGADVDPEDAPSAIRRAVATDGYAEIMIEQGMAPYFKALAYFQVEGTETSSELFEGELRAILVETPSWSIRDRVVEKNTVIKIIDGEPDGGCEFYYTKDGETMPYKSLFDNGSDKVYKYDSAQGIKITEDVVLWAIAYKTKDGVLGGSERLRNGKFEIAKPKVNVSLTIAGNENSEGYAWVIGKAAPIVNVSLPEDVTLGEGANDVAVKMYIYDDNPLVGWTQLITQNETELDMTKAIEANYENAWSIDLSLVQGNDPEVEITTLSVNPTRIMLDIIKEGEKPAKPVPNIPSGTVEPGTKITLSCATDSATIYYTLGIEAPDVVYKEGYEFTVNQDMSIRTMAVKDGIASDIADYTYKIPLPERTVEATVTPAPGEILAGTEIEIELSEPSERMDITGYKLYPTIEAANEDISFNNTCNHYPSEGKPVPTVENPVLRVGVFKVAQRQWKYFDFVYYIKKDISMPVITPEGGEVAMGTEVEIKHAEGVQGAKIYYTLNDSVPEVGKDYTQEYTQKIKITEAVTIKAMAFKAKTGENDRDSVSNVTVAVFTLLPLDTVEAPTFSIPFDEVEKGTKVSINCTTPNAKIYYTLNGEDPTEESALYSEPIELNETVTIKAIATKEYMINSPMRVKTYTVKVANETNELAGVSIYPNPTDGKFNITVPVNAMIEVFTANGQMVKCADVVAGLNTMRLENSGIYFVRVRANGQVAIKKVVVR